MMVNKKSENFSEANIGVNSPKQRENTEENVISNISIISKSSSEGNIEINKENIALNQVFNYGNPIIQKYQNIHQIEGYTNLSFSNEKNYIISKYDAERINRKKEEKNENECCDKGKIFNHSNANKDSDISYHNQGSEIESDFLHYILPIGEEIFNNPSQKSFFPPFNDIQNLDNEFQLGENLEYNNSAQDYEPLDSIKNNRSVNKLNKSKPLYFEIGNNSLSIILPNPFSNKLDKQDQQKLILKSIIFKSRCEKLNESIHFGSSLYHDDLSFDCIILLNYYPEKIVSLISLKPKLLNIIKNSLTNESKQEDHREG